MVVKKGTKTAHVAVRFTVKKDNGTDYKIVFAIPYKDSMRAMRVDIVNAANDILPKDKITDLNMEGFEADMPDIDLIRCEITKEAEVAFLALNEDWERV